MVTSLEIDYQNYRVHRRKKCCCVACCIICIMIFLTFGLMIFIFWYHKPSASIFSESNIRLEQLGTIGADIQLRVSNINVYSIHFQNLFIDIYDSTDAHLGQLVRSQRATLKPRSNTTITVKGEVMINIPTLSLLAFQCIQNSNKMNLKMKGSVDGVMFGIVIPQLIPLTVNEINCIPSDIFDEPLQPLQIPLPRPDINPFNPFPFNWSDIIP